MHFSLQLSKHSLTLKQNHPNPPLKKREGKTGAGWGKEQGRKDLAILITAQ